MAVIDSEKWKDSVKMIRKSVWEFCSTVITTTDCSQLSTNIQVYAYLIFYACVYVYINSVYMYMYVYVENHVYSTLYRNANM